MPNQKVAFWISNHWAPHLETDIELISKHVNAGDDVTVFVCAGELATCYSNLEHAEDVCRGCVARRRNGLDLAGLADRVKIRSFLNISALDKERLEQYRNIQIESLEQLLAIKLDSCKIGHTVYNEHIGMTKQDVPVLSEATEYLSKAIETTALVFLSFRNNFSELKPDIFYLFNQRFVVTRPAMDAAIEAGVEYRIHDRAGTLNRYSVVINESLHSLDFWRRQIQICWNESRLSEAEKNTEAALWFDRNLKGVSQAWFSFTADQEDVLPETFDSKNQNIVIFNSSEWELLGVLDEYNVGFYESQQDALMHLATTLRARPDIQFFLRMHPHLKDKNNKQTDFIAEHLTNKFPNFHVIPSDSLISSYKLMTSADLVITFGSTTGIEAAYHKIPSLLLGTSWYDQLEACDLVRSRDEVIAYIIERRYKLPQEELEKRRARALKYGYLNIADGHEFERFQQTGVCEIKLKTESGMSFVTHSMPAFQNGLGKELGQRIELKSDLYNPLRSTVEELRSTADELLQANSKQAQEMERLRVEIARLQTDNKTQEDQIGEMCSSRAWKLASSLQNIKAKLTNN